jgi:patatin-related protein
MSEKPDFSCEHRLGLVVYGGVSLAIYMNGICQEFYNAVRGRGVYKLIKALTDADIVVDIVSGTSAGGINGVLLSYALANTNQAKQKNNSPSKQTKSEIKFEKFSEVWKNSGDIQKLLFQKEYDKVEKSSFFNGVGYYKDEVKKALLNRWKDIKEPSNEKEHNNWFSEFGELDLFITGTDLLGRVYQVFDNTGSVIDVKDHHTTFHLKYRENGDNDFKMENEITKNEITCEALAKLCQITSCFPVAFPPVTVKLKSQDGADERIVKWGDLKKNRILPEHEPPDLHKRSILNVEIDDDLCTGYRLHFVDGGVLDNRPFTHTIKQIYHRTAERPVFRKLFYVDPSPDCFYDSPKYKEMQKPNIIEVALGSLIGMPRYESINNDLELIKEHNEKVRHYEFLLADIENLLDKEKEDVQNEDIYDQQKNVYLRTRLINLKDKLLPLIFIESNDFLSYRKEGDKRITLDKVAESLTKPLIDPERESERLKLLEELGNEIRDLDIDYALRRYLFIANYVYRLLDENYLAGWFSKKKEQLSQLKAEQLSQLKAKQLSQLTHSLRKFIKKLNKQIKKLEAINGNLNDLFASKQMESYFFNLAGSDDTELKQDFPKKFYQAMLYLHGSFLSLNYSENLSITDFSKSLQYNKEKLLKTLEKDLDEFLKQSDEKRKKTVNQLSEQSVLKKIANATEGLILKFLLEKDIDIKEEATFLQKKLKDYFYQFETMDTFLYPLDYLGGVSEKQIIETYRISPEDANLGLSKESEYMKKGKRLKYKLSGDSLNAFGGFLKESWRANDILWGRLDGLNRIIEALISEDKIKNFPNFVQRQTEIWNDTHCKEKLSKEEYVDNLLDEALYLSDANKNKSSEVCNKNEQDLKAQKEKIKEKLQAIFPGYENQKEIDKISMKKLLSELVESLVDAAHLIILDEDFDETMRVYIGGQFHDELQKQSRKNGSDPQYLLKEDKFNSALSFLAVQKLARDSLASMSLIDKKDFFTNPKHYTIGSETLDDIPKVELRKIMVRFVTIFQDILTTIRGYSKKGEKNNSTRYRLSQFGFAFLSFIVVIFLKILVRFL